MKKDNNIKLIREKKKITVDKKKLLRVMIVLLAVGVCIGGYFLVRSWVLNRPYEEPQPMTDEEKLILYVGPKECEDQGEWVDPVEYYGLFGDDAKEADIMKALYAREGDLRGIVPQGIRIEPVMVSYDDFEPFTGYKSYGFQNAYSCSYESDSLPVESQIGIDGNMTVSGSYSVENDGSYTGEVSLDISDMSFGIENTIDLKKIGTEEYNIEISDSNYSFLKPVLGFDYSGSGRACRIDEDGNTAEEIEFVIDESADGFEWRFTTDLTGQDNGIFRTGAIYIRCKLPAKYKVSAKDAEASDSYDGFVNVYFKVCEVRLGTWDDTIPY